MLKEGYFRAEIKPTSQAEAICVLIQMLIDSYRSSKSNLLKIDYSDDLVKDVENIFIKEIESYRKEDNYGK